MSGSATQDVLRSLKVDEAQALARRCAGKPDFLPCDGLSACVTHSHGKCSKLHWCCHLGWCHCKYVYQPMTSLEQLPSTSIPSAPSDHVVTTQLSVSLSESFLKTASRLQAPPCPGSQRHCPISGAFTKGYMVKHINGRMCYVQCLTPSVPSPIFHKLPLLGITKMHLFSP